MPRPPHRPFLFNVACAGMLVFGFVGALLGTLFGYPGIRARFSVDYSRLGDLFSVLYTGLLVTTLVAGPIIDRLGNRFVLMVGSILVMSGLLGFAGGHDYGTAVAATLALGVGGGGLNIATNALVSDLYPDERGRMLSYVAAFFGVGAVLVPTLAAIAGEAHVGLVPVVAAAIAFAAAVASAALAFPPGREAGHGGVGKLLAAVRQPGVLWFAALLFFQTGNEASISGWISSYIGESGWPARVATTVLAGYWLTAIGGRMVVGRLHGRVSGHRLLVTAGVGSAVGCAWLMLSHSLPMLVAAALFTSLAICGVYPTTLALAGNRYQKHAGTVFGALFSIGGLGGMALPPLLGRVSQAAGLRTGLVVPLTSAALVTLLALIIRARLSGPPRS